MCASCLSDVIVIFVSFSSGQISFRRGSEIDCFETEDRCLVFLLLLASCVILEQPLTLSEVRHAYLSAGVTTTCPGFF